VATPVTNGCWRTASLRDQAAGRLGSELGGLDLTQERAALAREQREGQSIKNAVARKEYAPVGLLADVLGMVASAVVDRFDQWSQCWRRPVRSPRGGQDGCAEGDRRRTQRMDAAPTSLVTKVDAMRCRRRASAGI
jgi:hypothetical protein